MRDGFFDVAVGNIPFGGFGVNDKKYEKHGFQIHDYFFAKSLDQVRTGGIIAFVTSKGTLDKANSATRKYIAQRADLLGAIRLPNTAFLRNAGTEVTSDIIFLQKREGLREVEPDWVHLGHIPDGLNPEKNIPVNNYFAENPHMILGTMTTESGKRMYGNENTATCVPFPEADLSEQLRKAFFHMQGQITEREISLDDIADISNGLENAGIYNDYENIEAVKNFSYTVNANKVFYRDNFDMQLGNINK